MTIIPEQGLNKEVRKHSFIRTTTIFQLCKVASIYYHTSSHFQIIACYKLTWAQWSNYHQNSSITPHPLG